MTAILRAARAGRLTHAQRAVPLPKALGATLADINPAEGGVRVYSPAGPMIYVSQRLHDALNDYAGATSEWPFAIAQRLINELEARSKREAGKRRERSDLTEADCLEVLRGFAQRVNRMIETSDPQPFAQDGPDGTLVVSFQVNGAFGVADPLFEAIRVLGGHKLPAKEPEA